MLSKYIIKLFNFIGGTKRLEFLPKEYFKSEFEKRILILSRKFTRDEIQNNNELFNE